ncbi:collagenous repeat-containing protein [Daphnia pulex]|uniref:Collagenous repeat-containing protein n=1 Tax=Daphnia pulex TaxID=6669 RepID=E9GCP4_DAPPU|nr:collagenous repeat-containing protein [Daphnia pulex]|eukprot:EFX82830.1 collagenous repeat-containing protein [Daphnia pulex]
MALFSFTIRRIQMKQIVTSLESTVIEQQAQLKAQLELNNELRQDLALKVKQLEAKVEQQDSLLKIVFHERKMNAQQQQQPTLHVPIGNNQSAVAINGVNGLPSSCGDLKMIGHIWSGIYFVIGSAKMESVYCDFNKLPSDAGFQKWIGYADVKSAPVHFYVQRNSYFNSIRTPIPYDLALVNEGNAMNLTSGVFTAPRPGIYFFSFTGVARLESMQYGAFLHPYLYLNAKIIGSSYVYENKGPVDQYSQLTLQSTLNLKTGDQLWVTFEYTTGSFSSLYDTSDFHYTHFTGFMLEEEIVASL